MRNDPRGQERLRGTRFRNTARRGCPTTDLLRGLPVGRRNGISLVAVAAAAIVVTPTVRGDETLLCYDGLQPLHSRPIQALSRPLPRILCWL